MDESGQPHPGGHGADDHRDRPAGSDGADTGSASPEAGGQGGPPPAGDPAPPRAERPVPPAAEGSEPPSAEGSATPPAEGPAPRSAQAPAPPPAEGPAEKGDRGTGQGDSGPRQGDSGTPRSGDGGTPPPPAPAPPPEPAPPSSPAPSPFGSAPQDDPDRSHARGNPRGAKPPSRRPEPGGGILMGRPFGVPVYVAPSWFLVAVLITWVFGEQLERVLPELGGARYLVSLFFAVAFYASVLVHELAHTVAALRFELPVRRIQLQFFGGVSEIEKESESPGREFVLAFVGPLLSLVLAGVFYLGMLAVEPGTVPGVLLAGLMISNLLVAAFNLLPGLPLDGGRMLRAVVWKITGKPMSGTVAAAWVGRGLALSVLVGLPLLTQSGALGDDAQEFGGWDTLTDALLAAILAGIIWTGAGNSLRMARLREHLPELRARTLTRRAVPVAYDTPLSESLRRANDAGARALVVVDPDGEPRALVREAAIVGVPQHRRPWVAAGSLSQELSPGMLVSAELSGEELLDVLRATPASEYLVVEESGEIYGVLSAADVERAFVKAMARPN
ncbi:site-2 protease family protein [Streptomyces physcomitrii]|uniref:site-2 protease family protein n=1 Tax=Streptomyces physcomitrii TaxID=2724184 RepID=UPI0034183481